MTESDLRAAYCSALARLFKTTPGTKDNMAACEDCAKLYDTNPALCDEVDDALPGILRMSNPNNNGESQ